MRPLRATARLQLHEGFDLRAAAAQVSYYAALGISHLYLSPVQAAAPGSTHGYDGIDPGRVDPRLGGEDALRGLATAAHAAGMGLLLDIVPNHLATHPDNRWWWDVLRHGRRSRYARWFDIDWDAPGAGGRLCLPVLDQPLEVLLESGQARARATEDGYELELAGQRFPLAPPPPGLDEPLHLPREALRRWIAAQAWRLLPWRDAGALPNYRRFFDISGLVALRVERPDVFAAVHALPLRLVAEGLVDGLRIDHIDGLADPAGYLRRLRRALDAAAAGRGPPGSAALYVEKILASGEELPAGWECDGTTGYGFMDQASAVLHAAAGEPALRRLWRQRSGRSGDFAAEEHQARLELLQGPLQPEFARACAALEAVAAGATGAHAADDLAAALAALVACFPVYRLYPDARGLGLVDRQHLCRALRQARTGLSWPRRRALRALARWLQGNGAAGWRQRARLLRLRRRVAQLSAPLNAKAVEDTAFYRHGVLLSRNEVGSDPRRLALSVADFDAACRLRLRRWPRALLATATHDHKRGEDLRARLAVLSERADWWAGQVARFESLATPLWARHGGAGAWPGEAPMLWQTLVGGWPPGLAADDEAGLQALAERVAGWQLKAAREAKLRTGWIAPDAAYEADMHARSHTLLQDAAGLPLRTALAAAAAAIAVPGVANALAQTVLRLTAPGVPDLYQGSEGWDFSLVDPDNRRPVDYVVRRRWLQDDAPWDSLLARWHDGALKARVVATLLQLRRAHPQLFAAGAYLPLPVHGPAAAHALAFARRCEDQWLVVVVPRHVSAWLCGRDEPRIDPACWRDTTLTVPGARYRNLLGAALPAAAQELALGELLQGVPAAVLLPD